jgi:hypothetical protein
MSRPSLKITRQDYREPPEFSFDVWNPISGNNEQIKSLRRRPGPCDRTGRTGPGHVGTTGPGTVIAQGPA